MKIAITAGHFNPIHKGHIEQMVLSKKIADQLIVIVANDEQQVLKIGYVYQDLETRTTLVRSLRMVDAVFQSIDKDPSSCKSLERVVEICRQEHHNPEILFTKGGDRYASEIPEAEVCKRLGVRIVDGLGKKVDNSSSYRKISHLGYAKPIE